LQTVSDAKVLSMPQLLVSANVEESKVESKDQQPTAQRNLSNGTGGGGSTDVISFGQYVDAGTKLTIKKPQIGPGNSIRMGLDIELSSFTGEATDTLPPPIQKNNIITEVQVPANMTVVVGGVVVDSKRKTVKKIPLLGDIPLFGALFSDQGSTDIKTTLYVFITPKILRDQTFQDHKLISSGPLKATELSDGMPGYKPVIVEFSEIKEEPAK
jgi:type II secretory pathway component GspD/PulD (secretin)